MDDNPVLGAGHLKYLSGPVDQEINVGRIITALTDELGGFAHLGVLALGALPLNLAKDGGVDELPDWVDAITRVAIPSALVHGSRRFGAEA